jgi:hypothetical protein
LGEAWYGIVWVGGNKSRLILIRMDRCRWGFPDYTFSGNKLRPDASVDWGQWMILGDFGEGVGWRGDFAEHVIGLGS